MRKKIKSSLWLKIFLLLTTLLFAVSILLYGTIMAVMPASYKYALTSNYTEQVSRLIADLEHHDLDDATQKIYEFCINNNAGALLSGNQTSLSFGEGILDEQQREQNVFQTASASLALENGTYTLQITMSARAVNQLTETFWRLLPIVGIAVLTISLIASYFVTRLLTKPILEISDISKRLTTLDMTWRCDTSRTDEVGTLALNLNTMAARLDSTLKELSAANEKLQADIEQERRQEKLRVDFFRAVSHELKTPITVLKGELEGMIYQVGEYKDRDTHLRQSLQTVNDMELLVKEILSASRMAGSDFSLTLSDVDLSQLVRECCRKWQGAAEDREQRFQAEIEDGRTCQGDMALLQKAVSNIIGNAVAHSPSQAEISVTLAGNILQVRNSGVSIDSANLEKIFEPFYRVDRSHNRNTGGSGLGLYIVKTILERHGFSFRMNSTDDEVCFTVIF
ncbi:HAMP domain-containing sensor histidine kinase [uncultured Acetatifactor sp.]|uniref:sensor histidine kinase n=1 Tax=uncultured Acetatifactor sp. TaxID=1671927 RepID=UPI0026372CAC|nr:HAMP domain-containing sensor histidine kinase [uncultured Acetatifactor sp.]